jgi:hypothetical protein
MNLVAHENCQKNDQDIRSLSKNDVDRHRKTDQNVLIFIFYYKRRCTPLVCHVKDRNNYRKLIEIHSIRDYSLSTYKLVCHASRLIKTA